MIHGGFEIDQRFVDHARHRLEAGLGQIVAQIFAFREGANAERVGVGGEHGQPFTDVLGGRAVHDGAES